MSSGKQTALTVVGAGAGFVLGGPTGAMYGAQIGYSLGMSTLSTTLPAQQGPRLDDFNTQVSEYGTPLGKSWGTVRRAGSVIWSGGIEETKHVEEQESGGKGAPKTSQSYETFTYSLSFAVAFNDGEVDAVRRIWFNEKIVYDQGDISDYGSLTNDQTADWIQTKTYGLGEDGGSITIYSGSETQEADPTIESYEGAGNVPGFRGVAYLVGTDIQLEPYGNRMPQVLVEFVRVDGSASTGSSTIKEIDLSSLNEEATFSNIFSGFDDDGTGHYFVGNWDAGYNSGGVSYYKVFPNGTSAYISQTDLFDVISSGWVWAPYKQNHDHPVVFYPTTNDGILWLEPGGDIVDGSSIAFKIDNPNTPASTITNHYICLSGNRRKGSFVMCLDNDPLRFQFANYRKGVVYSLLGSPSTRAYIDYLSPVEIDLDGKKFYNMAFSDNTLFALLIDTVGDDNKLVKVDKDSGEVGRITFSRSGSWDSQSNSNTMCIDRQNPSKVWISNNKRLHSLDYDTGEYNYYGIITPNSEFGYPSMSSGGLFYQTETTGMSILSAGDVSKTSETLDNIVTELCTESDLTSSDIDVTGLSGIEVDGFTFSSGGASKALESLMTAYQFSAYEDQNVLNFRLRNGSVDKVISETDLGTAVGNASDNVLSYRRVEDQNLPLEVVVRFIDYENNYAQGAQRSRRRADTVDSQQVLTIDLPLVMTPSKARQTAEIIQNNLFTSRTEYERFTLPLEYIDIVPTDIIEVTNNELVHEIRVDTVSISDVVEVSGSSNDSISYTSDVSGETNTWEYRGNQYVGITQGYVLNLPALRDQDSDQGAYIAAHGYTPGWRGAVVYVENNSGGYSKSGAVTGASTVGVATDVLSDGVYSTIDYENTVTVRMRNGTPTSTTKSGLLGEATLNAVAIGADGRWEIIQFITATDNGDGTYTLSGLIRGLLGTEFAMSQHAAGDLAIWLDVNNLTRIQVPDTTSSFDFRFVSIGSKFQTGEDFPFTNTERALKPLSPVHLEQSDNGDGTYDITWERRGRISGGWKDYKNVPLAEQSEEYTVKVFDTDGTTELSSTTVASKTATVTATSGQYVDVAQNSDFYGAGEYERIQLA